MIKPILKIELPNEIEEEQRKTVDDNLRLSDARNDYHIIITYTDTTKPLFEIITASDVSIHKP